MSLCVVCVSLDDCSEDESPHDTTANEADTIRARNKNAFKLSNRKKLRTLKSGHHLRVNSLTCLTFSPYN
ncbi:hypothetical protein GCM10017044_22740 [Kordiimonas sediminis]|uniref:Uncharacterized protein n=1 Tax=Kordiimonas sediminis TaxID=1735581 RepID=A0A919E7U0_9PROT|nr:hypothetical protein GCM10017044_22740 [Kordiimonas sediminis]